MMAIKAEPEYSYRVPTGVSGPHTTYINILGIKYRYREGQYILFRSVLTGKGRLNKDLDWEEGTITQLLDYFMVVATKNYITSIDYRDILTEDVTVKVI